MTRKKRETKIVNLWPDQARTFGEEGDDLPPKIQFCQQITAEDAVTFHHFNVRGWIWDFELNTVLRISKVFDNKKDATHFFKAVKKKYPEYH